ncbi:MAG: CCA tRNA nucleotidyltransferase [Gemmatimonadetes bacterium]|nr:CCA tRNA nucleotidyltransferase [Gemmatimonadota bacterium]
MTQLPPNQLLPIRLAAPKAVHWIVSTLEDAGHETWAVGGAVRDALAGRPSDDWDFATRARPNDVQRIFRRTVPIGVEHGTVGVLARDGTLYEVTTFRRDVRTTGRHAEVAFADHLEEDLARRDFTINAVAWHPIQEIVHDPFGGRADMERRILRTVGKPSERFAEDYLRVLRALRFAGTFRLEIEAETWSALVAAVEKLGILSAERLHEELQKVLSGEAPPSRALALYVASGVARFLYPELDRMVGLPRVYGPGAGERRGAQEGGGEWFGHTLAVVDRLPAGRPDLRWAALLRGLGETGPLPEGDVASARDELSLLRAAAILERLKASNARIREIAEVAAFSSRPLDPGAGDEELRRWLSRAGRERLRPVLRIWGAVVRADMARGEGRNTSRAKASRPGEVIDPRGRARLARRLRAIAASGAPLRVEELAFNGRDLIRMGFAPGPHFREVLRSLLDGVLTDPSRNRSEALEEEAAEWLEAHGISPRGSG